MKFCCKTFHTTSDKRFVEFFDEIGGTQLIWYDIHYRSYMLYYNELTAYEINYCPWCGKKLPENLTDRWWEVLEKDYGITDPRGVDRKKVPAEFWTDEWWKKRGL